MGNNTIITCALVHTYFLLPDLLVSKPSAILCQATYGTLYKEKLKLHEKERYTKRSVEKFINTDTEKKETYRETLLPYIRIFGSDNLYKYFYNHIIVSKIS